MLPPRLPPVQVRATLRSTMAPTSPLVDDTYTFMLKGIARDIDVESSSSEDGVGVVAADDLVRVVVNGQRAVASNADNDGQFVPDGTGPFYRVVVLDPGDC